jgi:hypothetical protein
MSSQPMRIVLDAEDFFRLVSGQEVEKPGCKIILSDIGFELMTAMIRKAVAKQFNES